MKAKISTYIHLYPKTRKHRPLYTYSYHLLKYYERSETASKSTSQEAVQSMRAFITKKKHWLNILIKFFDKHSLKNLKSNKERLCGWFEERKSFKRIGKRQRTLNLSFLFSFYLYSTLHSFLHYLFTCLPHFSSHNIEGRFFPPLN